MWSSVIAEKYGADTHFDKLKDLKETDYVNFCGTIVYRKKVNVSSPAGMVLNLGLVHGVSEVFVNGQSCGVKWYGRRIHPVSARLKQGENSVEVHVVTVMGNYMKTLGQQAQDHYFSNHIHNSSIS